MSLLLPNHQNILSSKLHSKFLLELKDEGVLHAHFCFRDLLEQQSNELRIV